MHIINAKPLSVNQCWQGRRFKTITYDSYEEEILFLLPKIEVPKGKLNLICRFGLSSKNADCDNLIKPFLDILQKKYGFNDKNVYRIEVTKEDVPKGEEFIAFSLAELTK